MDYVIIVAGGKGLRMGSDIPKQFLPIGGKPVLMRTLERFRDSANIPRNCRLSSYCPKTSRTIGFSYVSSIISG